MLGQNAIVTNNVNFIKKTLYLFLEKTHIINRILFSLQRFNC
jgi:hypothetical protein